MPPRSRGILKYSPTFPTRDMVRRSQSKAQAGFSLPELIITLSLIAILVGVVGFRSSNVVEKSKVNAILQLTRNLTTACALYQADTGLLPVEYPDSSSSNFRDLSSPQTSAGWAGPYLDQPLTHGDSNPYGHLRLYNRVNVNGWIPGFDVDGDGTVDVASGGNLLWLDCISEESAALIDRQMDSGVPGDWATTGNFRWDSGREDGYVLIFH